MRARWSQTEERRLTAVGQSLSRDRNIALRLNGGPFLPFDARSGVNCRSAPQADDTLRKGPALFAKCENDVPPGVLSGIIALAGGLHDDPY